MSLTAENLGFGYGKASVLAGIDLAVEPGEIVSVIGPNGAGKSTLLKCLLRVLKPREGKVSADGEDVERMNPRQRARKLSYVPQALPGRFPMSVFDTVLLGRRPHLSWRPSSEDVDKVSEALSRMGLSGMALRDFDTLSGGQKQKVMLARAFAQEADYLLLDEPTSNLDLRHQIEVMGILRETVDGFGKGALVAIHNLNTAARFSDRIAMFLGGRVHDCGPPAEVLSEGNIESVYGVRVETANVNGHRVVIPQSIV